MKICKDGRIWGQNNKEAKSHLGVLTEPYKKKGRVRGKEVGAYFRAKRGNFKGENNPSWKGGISSQANLIRSGIECRLWREAVFARDNWTCQECGKKGLRLNAHHIKSFVKHPELRFAIDNGKTLCYECHKLTENFGKQKEK